MITCRRCGRIGVRGYSSVFPHPYPAYAECSAYRACHRRLTLMLRETVEDMEELTQVFAEGDRE